LIEYSDFASWPDVSKRFWPLYAQAATLAPTSPLRGEIAKIAAASPNPITRAEAALRLVEIRSVTSTSGSTAAITAGIGRRELDAALWRLQSQDRVAALAARRARNRGGTGAGQPDRRRHRPGSLANPVLFNSPRRARKKSAERAIGSTAPASVIAISI